MEFGEHGKEKAIVNVENLWNMEQMIRKDGIQTNSKSKTSCSDSNLKPRCEASGTSKDLTKLRRRLENRKSAESGGGWRNREDGRVAVAQSGAYVNDVHNFSIKIGGKKTGLGQMK
ncbi:hypothetical protein AVEN_64405-1 [Araneus ventricosus]|uniref:Uncharacterized protein n=1 Tax=Araneus ventricosus TaxID=182803 RepID=A0A4Y2H7M6_ARAVE|nr:hypothetical protein AVEN_64405-1 [Araneus ventricosus]